MNLQTGMKYHMRIAINHMFTMHYYPLLAAEITTMFNSTKEKIAQMVCKEFKLWSFTYKYTYVVNYTIHANYK